MTKKFYTKYFKEHKTNKKRNKENNICRNAINV